MTKEEQLKQEAEEYAKENYCDEVRATARNAYLDCARLREKQIQIDAEQIRALQKQNGELTDKVKELEAQIKRISGECHKLVDTLEKKQNKNELLETQNIKLQAEVSRLTIKNADLIGKIAFTENALNNAKAQIEKMKNWCNCNNYQQCLIELAEQGKGMNPSECCVNCKKWEMKEK